MTYWGLGGACRGGYVLSAVIERPYAEVLEQAKSKLIDAGYSWNDHTFARLRSKSATMSRTSSMPQLNRIPPG